MFVYSHVFLKCILCENTYNSHLIAARFLDPRYKDALFNNLPESCLTYQTSIINFLATRFQKLSGKKVQAPQNLVQKTFDYEFCLNNLILSTDKGISAPSTSPSKANIIIISPHQFHLIKNWSFALTLQLASSIKPTTLVANVQIYTSPAQKSNCSFH